MICDYRRNISSSRRARDLSASPLSTMRSSSSSVSGRSAKRSKTNPKTPVLRSPFTDVGSYMEAKNRKLRSQFETEASSSSLLNGETSSSGAGNGIFHGVSIFVDGHTVPSSQELRGYMLRQGGRYENYFSRSRVTHIICSNLPHSKMKNLRAFSRGLPVLKPSWVLDSMAANKLLSWPPYQLTEHSSDTRKQQKLSTFFGCKRISPLKNAEVASESDEETDHEASRPDLVLDKEVNYSTLLNNGNKVEADSSPAQLSIHSDSHSGEFSEEPTDKICQQTSDVHHSTHTDPNFVENYFKHSRLHFIGTWRNRYRKRFCNMLKGESSKVNVDSCSSPNKNSIIHIDMDCFFVSVIIRKYPELLDKPVAVCHSNNSGGTAEISSANYPARSFGIRAGMFVRDAKACCPNLVVFPYDFGGYEEVADQFYSILHKHCNKVQALSCDEAFLDISELMDLNPESFASAIRKEIEETTQCTATAGIAGNLLMARLATKVAKPNGQYFIPPEKVETFLEDLSITSLPGIGRAIGDKLESRQIRTCGQLRLVSKESLRKDFGAKTGDMLWNYCRGIDDRKVEVLKETKSIGAEVNWGVRFLTSMDCEHFLNNLSKEVSSRLQECGVVARTVTLKLKMRRKGAREPIKFMGCGDCENMSRSVTLPVATDDATLILRTAKQIFASYRVDVKEVRGVGLQMLRLELMDVNRQSHKHNVLESWLTVSREVGEESAKSDNQIDVQHNGNLHEYSHLRIDRAASSDALHVDLCNSRSSYENASSALPPVCLLDMNVIKDLPDEIISEMNDAYNGKLYDLMRKHDEDQKSNSNLITTPLEVLRRGKTHELNQQEKADVSEIPLHVELPGFCPAKSNISQTELASGSSSKALSIVQAFSPDANLDKSALAQLPNQKSKINLWSGSPPKWVEKFEVSNCLILNLTAQLFTEYRTGDLLSPILQLLISLYPLILGSSIEEEPLEAHFELCELLLQYIDLKIDSDIEELHLCCLLLERLASVSTVFSEVHGIVLPALQVSVSENYGGVLQLIGNCSNKGSRG